MCFVGLEVFFESQRISVSAVSILLTEILKDSQEQNILKLFWCFESARKLAVLLQRFFRDLVIQHIQFFQINLELNSHNGSLC